jgi:DNA-binding protein Fis
MNGSIASNEVALATTVEEPKPLSESVRTALGKYFDKLENSFANNVYEMVLSEVEKPLLDAVMAFTRGNQSKAAIMLGLSRGTLRKKLKIYGFIS